jgi:uncharacterized protein HemX
VPPELIPSTPVQWGLVGVLVMIIAAGVYGLMSGRLVPRQAVDDVRKDRDDRLKQAQEVISLWKDLADTQKGIVSHLMPVLQEIRKDQEHILRAASLFIQEHEKGGGG